MGRVVLLGKGKQINKDIELCRTTHPEIGEQAISLLIKNHIPFTKSWISIPFFLRERFHGANEICVILTNRNHYSQARQTIDQLDAPLKRRLVLSNY